MKGLVGFNGRQVRRSHSREEPEGLRRGRRWYSNHQELLPTDALNRDFELIAIHVYREPDPYVLYDRWGRILYQWPEDYEPSFVEVFEVSRRFLKRR